MKIYLHYDADKFRVYAAVEPGVQDDRFKEIPGCRWYPAKGYYSFIGTSRVAERVLQLTEHLLQQPGYFDYEIEATQPFLDLRNKIVDEFDANEVKVDENLVAIPVTNYKPWLHQLRAYHYARRMEACMLAMAMSSGKTKIIYDLIQNTEWMNRILVVAPKKVIDDVWVGQFDTHWRGGAVDLVALSDGTIAERSGLALEALERNASSNLITIIVVNFDIIWQSPFKDVVLAVDWDLTVLDESHRIRAAGGVMSKFLNRLGHKSRKRICMSGTPLANGPRDVYGQYRFLDAGIFGTNVGVFDDLYVKRGGYMNSQILGYKNLDEFNEKFHSIAFVVDEEELDLPDTLPVERKCKLEPAVMEIYKELDKEFTVGVGDGSVTAGNALVKSTRLRQIAAGYVKMDDRSLKEVSSAKSELLADVLGDVDIEEPLVIFGWFHPELDSIRRVVEVSGRTCGELSGRRDDLATWKSGEMDVLAVQMQAGSLGIDLTRSRYALFYSVGFDLDIYRQCVSRVVRTTQGGKVILFHLLATATIEIEIMAALREKRRVVQSVMDARRIA